MIAYLSGKIIFKKDKYIVVDVNGVGYKVFLSQKALSIIPEIGQTINLRCFTNVKEDAIDIYGFLTEKELEFFETVESIHGIGPKASLEISSLGSLDSIKERILNKDETVFDGIPGIGKKRAMTIVLELTGKIKEIKGGESTDEAEQGLMNLGFSKQQSKSVLSRISKTLPVEDRVKEALKLLSN
ncbi:MAG: Holliday junction branch migration protein RuvA [bacterium]|nr:Holliday junction branch migration protein RuvA [bacterium]